MSSSLFLKQCPACLVHLIWIIFVMGGWWPYSYCFVEYCLQDLFNNAHSILAYLPLIFFSSLLVSIHVVHPYSSIDMITAWKKLCFILSVRSDFYRPILKSYSFFCFHTLYIYIYIYICVCVCVCVYHWHVTYSWKEG